MLSTFTSLGLGASPASPFTWGHAAYTYGPLHCTPKACDVVPSCNRAHWAQNISDFNTAAPGSDNDINMCVLVARAVRAGRACPWRVGVREMWNAPHPPPLPAPAPITPRGTLLWN